MNFDLQWLRALTDWLRERFSKQTSKIQAIEHYKNDHNHLFLIYQYDISTKETPLLPGLVSLWYVSNKEALSDLILIVINIAQARTDRLEYKNHAEQWLRQFEVKIRSELREQESIDATHIFVAGWVTKKYVAERFVNNRIQKFRHLEASTAIAFDCQGVLFAYGVHSNEPAKKLLKVIAHRCFNITPSRFSSWEALIRQLDNPTNKITWLTWLTQICEKMFGSSHTLQPKKVKQRVDKNDQVW